MGGLSQQFSGSAVPPARRLWLPLLLCLALSLVVLPGAPARAEEDALPAFPGAEGLGAFAQGGRGGEVYHVTSRELTGPGTFHHALTTAGDTPRTIVFDIGGEIEIPQIIVRNKARITIAGQTAPGDGVTIAGNNIRFLNSSDIVVRHLRFRNSDQAGDDTMYFEDCQNVIIDHSSFSWGGDEVLSIKSKDYDNPRSKNISVQWSIISEGLLTHSMGGLVEMNTISMHHNLYAHNNDRNPKTKGPMDFVNNVVYNWGGYAYVAGGESGTKGYGNVVGNYFIAGANSTEPQFGVFRGNENYQVYLADNRIDGNLNDVLDGHDPGEKIMESDRPSVVVDERFAYPPVHTESPESAYEHVLDHAGASLRRDAVDRRVISSVRFQTGVIIDQEGDVGGFPELAEGTAPADADRDGMPDGWETARGLDPDDPADRNGDDNGNGYTNLEEYLNELAAPGFPAGYPLTPVDWDGDQFEPPVAPKEEPEPLAPLNGEVARSVVVNDGSANGAENATDWSLESNLQVGDATHGDRGYRFTELPADLLGAEWIRSANDSRGAANEDLVRFHVARDTDVYLAHDARISPRPAWLTSQYEDTGTVIIDDQPVTYTVFKRHVTAGTRVVLGPNAGGSTMNYIAAFRPTAEDTEVAAPAAVHGEVTDGTASLRWDPVETATAYVVYRTSLADPYPRSVATTTEPEFNDANLAAGMPYGYRIAAVNSGGESAPSEQVDLAHYDDSAPPPGPGTPEAEARSYSVSLDWAEVDGAVGYAVERAGAGGEFAVVTRTTRSRFTDTAVQPSTSYRYRVIALGAGGASGPSETVGATTNRPLEHPTTPATPRVEEIDFSSVSLKWDEVTDAQTYEVQRLADGGGDFTPIASVTKAEYVADVPTSATGYRYRIVAENERGRSEPSEAVQAAVPRPAVPERLVVGLTGERFVGLIFKPGAGNQRHVIYRSRDGEPAEKLGTAGVSTFYDRTAEPGQQYTYTVRAENAAGESAPSDEVVVRTYAAGQAGQAQPWAADRSYGPGDLVRHDDRTWVAHEATDGEQPGPDRGPWLEAGEFVTGALGPQRAWTASWHYTGGELVAHDGHWWQAQARSRNQPPGGSDAWRRVS
ncbi:pectinesterase [Microlunatus parietis]|uniref:Fibronectin type 3 domain-containing protein n=1 Tax=Microlunatus parietis TaxID=682979 RepID=A0A7Y9LDV6_9ACTN|nr:pectinesterase [Microlunatus parietis]NYE74312.1 fibronectin type 3 domain-containing protein [Microlunatus parietis]